MLDTKLLHSGLKRFDGSARVRSPIAEDYGQCDSTVSAMRRKFPYACTNALNCSLASSVTQLSETCAGEAGSGMKREITKGLLIALAALVTIALACLAGCSGPQGSSSAGNAQQQADASDALDYLRIASEEPDTGDPQCTADYYDIALNVFDRLVETEAVDDGTNSFVPSLADSWQISDDGLVYTFKLREGVSFSNGSPLTSSDVEYTIERALANPDSQIAEVFEFVEGSQDFAEGKAQHIEGFRAVDDHEFSITLTSPYAAFLSMLSIPAVSILDEETTSKAGSEFGRDPDITVGTGPFVFSEWSEGKRIVLSANKNCWSGAPGCPGVVVNFVTDAEAKRLMFVNGELDILDLENLGPDAEYFMRGDVYQEQLCHGKRVGLSLIALNESVKPLDDVRVRHALQLALDRRALLMDVFSGRGALENGIYPHGLIGHNPDLPEIPYDPQAAADLLNQAGYPDGFDLEICFDKESLNYRETAVLAASMWEKIGVRTTVTALDKSEFTDRRNDGRIACYPSKFSVDYNDPDSIIYIFYGSLENSRSRSLCYGDEAVISRVNDACFIVDDAARLAEYRELERKIVHEDCAWVPLFSNEHYFVVSNRAKGFKVSWNGWTNTQYRDIVIEDAS